MLRLITASAVLLLLAFAAFSPWISARRLLRAVDRGDAEAIAHGVDFVAVRPGLAARVTAEAPTLAHEILPRTLTPDGFARLMQNAPDADAERAATEPGADTTPPRVTMGYAAPGRFRMVVGDRAERSRNVVMYMSRRWVFLWRVERVEPPQGFIAEGMATPAPEAARPADMGGD
jgi:hypothetical protein